MSSAPPPQQAGGQLYAGERLGLPRHGAGSVASWGRRLAALFVDWLASLFVAAALTRVLGLGADWGTWLPLFVFWLESSFFVALLGGSFGQLSLKLQVRRLDGGPVGLLPALVRGLLVCMVIPPVIYNRDNRGLHDLLAGTVVVTR